MIPQVIDQLNAAQVLPTAAEARELLPLTYNADELIKMIAVTIRRAAKNGDLSIIIYKFDDVTFEKIPPATASTVVGRLRSAGYEVSTYIPRDFRDTAGHIKISWEPK